MKKMYNKPVTEKLQIQTGSIVCTSPGMNNDAISGTDNEHRPMGQAPALPD